MTDYRLDIYNTAGVLQRILTDFSSLSYAKRVNSPGVIQFTIPGDHALLSTIADKWQIEVWRKTTDTSTWGREITGIYRMLTWGYGEQSYASIFCNGLMSILDWRIVGYRAGIANRSKFTGVASETVCNTLVKYNATTSATTADGRIRDGHIDGLTVEADGEEGEGIDWFCAYDNLLESLQDICKLGHGDFDVVKTSSTAWEYRWYKEQLGTDKTASVIFSIERGNMANPVYRDNRTQERTAAIVGGQGEDIARTVSIVTGANYHVDTNNIEMFVNATDVETSAGLTTRGTAKLKEKQAVKEFTFDVLQVPSCMYGTHYVLGDLITAINPYNNASYSMKIEAILVNLDQDGAENITIEMSEPL